MKDPAEITSTLNDELTEPSQNHKRMGLVHVTLLPPAQ